jgi:Raf kinase inhibitor-like YbhB/YbcL family protein
MILYILFLKILLMATTPKVLKVSSPAFEANGNIPEKFTCRGENISPPLNVGDIPPGTKCLALIMDDPDAPKQTFVHWVVWDLPLDGYIPENFKFGTHGMNGAHKNEYTGPCPPSGTHRYFFKFTALDIKLKIPEGTDKLILKETMKGHILAEGELIGKYTKR